jgi:hypothetical protein
MLAIAAIALADEHKTIFTHSDNLPETEISEFL